MKNIFTTTASISVVCLAGCPTFFAEEPSQSGSATPSEALFGENAFHYNSPLVDVPTIRSDRGISAKQRTRLPARLALPHWSYQDCQDRMVGCCQSQPKTVSSCNVDMRGTCVSRPKLKCFPLSVSDTYWQHARTLELKLIAGLKDKAGTTQGGEADRQ